MILSEEEAEKYRATLVSAATKSKALIYQKASTNFAAFCRAVLKDERTQERIVPAPIHLEWFKHYDRCKEEGYYCGILAPPESGKSQIMAIGLPLYEMGRDPAITCAVVCSEEGMAKERVKPTKDYVQRDPDYRVIFPDALPDHPDKWTEKEFSIRRAGGMKDPTYRACGIMTPRRGARIRLLVGDDICTIKNTIMEPAMRPKVVDSYYEGFDDRLSPDSMVVYIGGIVHNQDLTNRLIRDPRFWFIIQRVSKDFRHIEQEDTRTGEITILPLWKHSWTPEFLRAKYEANERAFARAYWHQGYDDSERTFDEDAVNRAIRYVDEPDKVAPGVATVLGMDLAEKKRRGSCIIPISQVGAIRRVHEVLLEKWSGEQKASELMRMSHKYQTLAEVVENNALQDSIIDLINVVNRLVENPVDLNIIPFTTGKQKADEVLGLLGLAAEFKKGRWEILVPKGHRVGFGCKCGRCSLIEQLRQHPFGQNDAVMALWFGRSGLEQFGDKSDLDWVDGRKFGRGSRRQRRGQSRLEAFKDSRTGGRHDRRQGHRAERGEPEPGGPSEA